MFDFSQTKIRASALYSIMASDRKKTPMQLYLEACAEVVSKQEKYDKLKKKDGVMGFKYIEDIEKLNAIIPVLESQKDVEEPLSTGAKSFLKSLYSLLKYGKQSVFREKGNKYTRKGKDAEDKSIALVSMLEGKVFEKHEGRLENSFICGHPDVLDCNDDGEVVRVIDVKTPWDAESFFSLLGEELIPQYYWQMQAYLALTNCQHGEVHFCLVDHPPHQILDEKNRLLKSMNVATEIAPEFIEAYARLLGNMTFGDINPDERRLVFHVERNDEDLQKAYKQVEKCRDYLIEIEKMHLGIDNLVPLMQTDAI